MNRISWKGVELLSRLLEPDERHVVHGDFAESGESGGRALIEVMGLVLRRQAALWKHWRPWLALLGLAIPFGALVGIASASALIVTAGSVNHIAKNWNNPITRENFPGFLAMTAGAYLRLGCFCWITGFALGSLSRLTIRISGAMFWLILTMVSLAWLVVLTGGSALLGVFVLMITVLPSRMGMRQGARLRWPTWLRTIVSSATAITLASIAIHFAWRFGRFPILIGPVRYADSIFFLGTYWPVGLLVASGIQRLQASHAGASAAYRE